MYRFPSRPVVRILTITLHGYYEIWDVDVTGSGLCPVAGFGISCVEHLGSVNRELVKYYQNSS
jgi:hypothetical protein